MSLCHPVSRGCLHACPVCRVLLVLKGFLVNTNLVRSWALLATAMTLCDSNDHQPLVTGWADTQLSFTVKMKNRKQTSDGRLQEIIIFKVWWYFVFFLDFSVNFSI